MTLLHDFLNLFYPRICLACGKNLFTHENTICSLCCFRLPKTHFHLEEDNPVSRLFWGKVWIEHASVAYYYVKGGIVQRMVHQLKYKGERDAGIFLGRLYGKELMESAKYRSVDVIIPVPLHPTKQRKRGYNQSEVFAAGLSQVTGIPVCTDVLFRKFASATQTKKSKFNRWKNVENIFMLRLPEKIEGKHILLVDDVITTGSTLEACIIQLQTVPGVRVSVAAIAASIV